MGVIVLELDQRVFDCKVRGGELATIHYTSADIAPGDEIEYRSVLTTYFDFMGEASCMKSDTGDRLYCEAISVHKVPCTEKTLPYTIIIDKVLKSNVKHVITGDSPTKLDAILRTVRMANSSIRALTSKVGALLENESTKKRNEG